MWQVLKKNQNKMPMKEHQQQWIKKKKKENRMSTEVEKGILLQVHHR